MLGDINIPQMFDIINYHIEILIDKDHKIGHSYFMGINNIKDLKIAFSDKISIQ